MWQYNYAMSDEDSDELYHYGVLGMKWGVHRARRKLNNSNATNSDHNKAVKSLRNHRDKITNKISELNKKSDKLKKQQYKIDTKLEPKAAKMERKANKLEKKVLKAKTDEKAVKLMRKSNVLKLKASKIRNKNAKVKARIENNKKLKLMFAKGLNEVNTELIRNGKDFLYTDSSKDGNG